MKSELERARLNETTGSVLACAFKVGRSLGHGFLEKVYENALAIELEEAGHSVAIQRAFDVTYRGRLVGQYCPDIIVDEVVLIEIKAIRALDDPHLAQCMNYLRVTRLNLGLLLNFGMPKLEYRRVVWDF
ncbi:GxxExxY protein [Betaproteobacteria bacterium GR16-43]|nr:GxxExxY protein [Betaproteobacteria bacterium GR16-43]